MDGVITGGVTVKDFAIVGKVEQNVARRMLDELAKNEIGTFDGDVMEFSDGDRLKVAMMMIQRGAQVDEVAQHLSWQDFEGLAAQILEMKDFAVIRNHIMTKPRMEIDVIGIKLGVAMLIDCKHWKRHNSLDDVVQKQIERTKQYVARTSGAIAAPVIVTLYQDKMSFINKVPIVPIFQFSSFIDEFYGNLEDIETIEKESQ
ncbi:MAG: hypothetical protein LV468_01055 [Candidatus Nitrosotenuis sp.]|nr:hypothetical protein [Candidatus Nitrosotenuis sp.]